MGLCLRLVEELLQGLGIGLMFGGVNFLHEDFECIVGVNRDALLKDDLSGVDAGIDKVNGAASVRDAGFKGLTAGVEPGKGGKQGGVDIDYAVGIGMEKIGFDDAHEAGKDDVVGVVVS